MNKRRGELTDEFRQAVAEWVMKITADISNGIQPGDRLDQSYEYWVGYLAAIKQARQIFEDCVKKTNT